MSQQLDILLNQLDAQSAQLTILESSLSGIEKENLRVTPQGLLAPTPHPKSLGASLTHPYITTDYAENLIEIITPPVKTAPHLLKTLEETYRYVYSCLDTELLWAPSMPCPIASQDEISIAQYGSSHRGRLQTLYRVGLGHRYEKKMQTIAGIHFNFSLPHSFWQIWRELYAPEAPSMQAMIDEAYFGLLRNFFRYGWLIDYLFGASSAIDHSFIANRQVPGLVPYKQHSFYAPYACSLRMSDLGYHNATQKQLNISFNSLTEYLQDLNTAIQTPYAAYQTIFDRFGQNSQISANLLQTEAEYYAPARPKRVVRPGERQAHALQRAGVEYLEIRTLDINPYEPLGITLSQIYFTEVFLHYCLFTDSPLFNPDDYQAALATMQTVVTQGRKPDCMLRHPLTKKNIALREWAHNLFQALYQIADFLDAHTLHQHHHQAIDYFKERIHHPELLPSAKMLDDLLNHYDSFSEFGLDCSEKIKQHFTAIPLKDVQLAEFKQLAQESLQNQYILESEQTGSFKDYLQNYFIGDNA
ncbi:MAG TPA: glutamate--cysteine ligase [Gammaproteobacteria bacterium]|nr:glutamate--cysteine ligase [Gammaproteobacteria bacterium]